jgi:hypothetical protein
MSYWPRCQLSDYEKRYVTKYPSSENNVRGVLRRFYPAVLELTQIQRQPSFQFQTARRSKVFGFTFAGDIEQFAIKLQTATGEQLFSDFMEVSLLTGGSNTGLPAGMVTGQVLPKPLGPNLSIIMPSVDPLILTPAIELAPNQVLTIYGAPLTPYGYIGTVPGNYRIDITMHVWEYPGMPGSPR